MSWLAPVRAALGEGDEAIGLFFRDDDAGWNDPALGRLLDLFSEFGLALDLAAIPRSLGASTRQVIKRAIDTGGARVGIHQHGFAHANHQAEGRRSEFGAAREPRLARHEIRRGRRQLDEAFGDLVDPIFTPPWNRLDASHAALLPELGFRVLSRDATAPPLDIPGLEELPVRIDWMKKRKGERIGMPVLGEWIAQEIRGAAPVGIMLHHAVMKDADFAELAEFLTLIAGEVRLHCELMKDWSGART